MTTDIAVIAMAVVALASIGRDCWLQAKVMDRVRVVSPPKPKQDEAAAQPISAARRTGT